MYALINISVIVDYDMLARHASQARKRNTMARTAPTVGGTPVYVTVSFRWIDASGDVRTDSINVLPAQATNANIEAMAAALGLISNADLYEVQVSQRYTAVADSSNAVDAPKDSAFDAIVVQAKNNLGESKRMFIPAPEAGNFISGTDEIDPTETDLAAALAAYVNLLPAGYSLVGARYTERREVNTQVKF